MADQEANDVLDLIDTAARRQGAKRKRSAFRAYRSSAGRAVVSFEYVGRTAVAA